MNEFNNQKLEDLIKKTGEWCRPEHPGWETLRDRLPPRRHSYVTRFAQDRFRIAAVLLLAASVFFCVMLYGSNVKANATIYDLKNRLDIELNRVKQLLDELKIDKAIEFHGPALIALDRDRIGVNVTIDRRYIQQVILYLSEGNSIPVYNGPPTMPSSDKPMKKHILEGSEPLVLNGRVIKAGLKFVFYPNIEDKNLEQLIPDDLRNQEREFLLSPEGIITDPRPIDKVRDIKLHSILSDADEMNVNRYLVTGRITNFHSGMYAYLVIDPVTTNEFWVTSVLQPDAKGHFAVRAFLGDGSRPETALDRQIYQLFICLTPTANILNVGDRLIKPVSWSEKECIISSSRLKRNDGLDGFADTMVVE